MTLTNFRSDTCDIELCDRCANPATCNCPHHAYDAIRAAAQAGVKFTDDNMTNSLLWRAHNWCATYKGDFSYVLDLQARIRSGKDLTVGMARGIANCMVAEERRKLEKAAAPELATDGNYSNIVKLITESPLKWPKLRMTAEGETFRLTRISDKSQYAGGANILAEEETFSSYKGGMERRWLGRINADGTLTAGKAINNVIIGILDALNLNPAGMAAAYGKLTSRCCFCGKELSTDESLAVGYGPDCANNYGLPWGMKMVDAA